MGDGFTNEDGLGEGSPFNGLLSAQTAKGLDSSLGSGQPVGFDVEYQQQLESYGMQCSMSRKGNCWDNAVAESFFHSLKTEWMKDIMYHTRGSARVDVVEYIEMFYNCHRLHSFIGYKSPNDFERQKVLSKAA